MLDPRTKEEGMGLFDRHDYGRDYGGGRSLGDRMRGAWNRFETRLGGRGYDRGWRDRGADLTGTRWGGNPEREGRGYDAGDFAYRGTEPGWSTGFNRGAHDPQWDWRAAGGGRYDREMQRGWGGGYDRGFRARGDYDRELRGGYDRDLRGRYDRELRVRDRMHTDAGDPFGDRQSRTPFRMLRGAFDREETDRGGWYEGHQLNQLANPDRYDVGYRGWNRGVGDEPAYRREDFRGGWGRGYRG